WILLITFLMILLYWFLMVLIFHEELKSPEEYDAITQDGARIHLYRFPPKGVEKKKYPLLLCHGLGASAYNFADPRHNWAEVFSRHGYDTWVIDLRGHGKSKAPKRNWVFEDYLIDLDSAIQKILEVTGASKIFWVGHSMGGLLLYAYLITRGEDKIARGVTLGSPVGFAPDTLRPFQWGLRFSWLMYFLPKVPIRLFVQLTIPLFPFCSFLPIYDLQFNPENVELYKMWKTSFNALYSIPVPLMRQFERWAREHRFDSYDKKVNYLEKLEEIKTPILVISGRKDIMAHPKNVLPAYERLRGPKQYVELAKEKGFSADYGHIDLVFGKKAMEEVLPLAEAWLEGKEEKVLSLGKG
ncbi:MAG: alpha/beta hydrolase, partial [Planctomycetota bacterium]